MNTCRYCGAELTAENWFPSFQKKNHKCCKTCQVARTEANRKKDKQSNPAKHILRNAKKRALRDGLPFDLTEDDIVIPDRCPVLGIPLVFNEGNFKDASPSLAQFIPEKGYVRGNVAVISHKANVMKSSATIQEVESLQEVAALLSWVQLVALLDIPKLP